MGYKAKKTLKDNKKSIILMTVLWLILTIVLVAPIGYSIGLANQSGTFDLTIFIPRKYIFRTCYIYFNNKSIGCSIYCILWKNTIILYNNIHNICTNWII